MAKSKVDPEAHTARMDRVVHSRVEKSAKRSPLATHGHEFRFMRACSCRQPDHNSFREVTAIGGLNGIDVRSWCLECGAGWTLLQIRESTTHRVLWERPRIGNDPTQSGRGREGSAVTASNPPVAPGAGQEAAR